MHSLSSPAVKPFQPIPRDKTTMTSGENRPLKNEPAVDKPFYLLTTSNFYASYLICLWLEAFKKDKNFKGIWIRDIENSGLIADRVRFHRKHQGKHTLNQKAWQQLNELYGGISQSEQAMISLFGIPKYPRITQDKIELIGKDVNSVSMQIRVTKALEQFGELAVFTCLDRILRDWWMLLRENKRVTPINGHPAVLPYARGSHSIQQVAELEDPEAFKRAAGGTVHFIDEGIDTGPIIEAHRLTNPFACNSIAEVKAKSWLITYKLLIDTAKKWSNNSEEELVGTAADLSQGVEYSCKNYVPEIAVQSFQKMRERMQKKNH